MILSGKEITNRLGKDIVIEPFNESQLNPNSYNIRLHNQLSVHVDKPLDMRKENKLKNVVIPENGLLLVPGLLYIGRTVEYTETNNLVPMLEGRSSVGRLGINIHATAGFGDIGFKGFWTLEISVIEPVRIYPNCEIVQIFYHTVCGEFENYESGKYQNNQGVQGSKMYLEF